MSAPKKAGTRRNPRLSLALAVAAAAVLLLTACGGGNGVGSRGDGGRTGMAPIDMQALAVAIQPDGKLVFAGRHGNTYPDFALARYTADGRLDESFGEQGMVVTDVGPNAPVDYALAVRVQRDGKIIAAGPSVLPPAAPPKLPPNSYRGSVHAAHPELECFALVRYTATGNLDPSFGVDGKVRTYFGERSLDPPEPSLYSGGVDAAFMPDGRAVLAGVGETSPSTQGGLDRLALARYLPNGQLDPSLGRAGKVGTPFHENLMAVAIQRDGKILLAGNSLARYLSDGRLDRGFGSGGKAATGFGVDGWADAVATQRDGKIVIAGIRWASETSEDSNFALARYLPDGRLDRSFGRGGEVTTRVGGTAGAHAIAIQDDGKLVVGGGQELLVGKNLEEDFVLARYLPDGRLDRSFGSGGTVSTDVDGDGWAGTVAIQEDGKVIAVSDGLVRYTADGRLDPTFGAFAKR